MKSHDPAISHDRIDAPAVAEPSSGRLDRKIFRKAGAEPASPSAIDGLEGSSFGSAINAGIQGGGAALPGDLRGRFESSLGTDLGGVRIHTDAAAGEASAALGARAFAVGQDVFMGAGQYAPETQDGAWLVAHEVAHTVQQRGASLGPQTKLEVSEEGDAMETAADTAADAMVAGRPTSVGAEGGPAIARQSHGAARSPGALTAPQQRALDEVTRNPRTLHARSREHLLELVRTITGAWSAAPPHSEPRRTTASALVRLYDAIDHHLGDEFTAGGEPMMAWELPELAMIDPWVQDAGEASHRRHLPSRRHQPRPQPTPQPQATPQPQPQSTPGPVPLPNRVEGARVAELPHQPSAVPHVATLAAELLFTAGELIAHSLGAGLVAALASVIGAFQSIHSGDEFDHHITEAEGTVFNFCSAFAHAVRGESPGSGAGASDGVAGAARLVAEYTSRGGDPAGLRTAGFITLYGLAWRSVIQDVVHRLQNSLTPGFATTNFSRDAVRARLMETRVGGIFYRAHGGE